MLVYSDGRILGTVGGGRNEAEVLAQAMEVMRTGEARSIVVRYEGADVGSDEPICGGFSEIFIDPLSTAPTLIIFGAGHIGQALAKIAKIAGFQTVIVDDREEFANKENFPDAKQILVTDVKGAKEKLQLTPRSYVVIITRGHKNDLDVLRSFITSELRYIGMIGSKRKIGEMFETLENEGIARKLLEKVHAPIGLNIGSETPGEIAVSIVAELISVTHAAENGQLALKK
jgi:xanthine dehydrogenase accessory factor